MLSILLLKNNKTAAGQGETVKSRPVRYLTIGFRIIWKGEQEYDHKKY